MLARLTIGVVLLCMCIAEVLPEAAFIQVGDIQWESLPEDSHKQRHINCRNYDRTYKGRYQWRFNGSSILPSTVKNAGSKLVFSNNSNAKRRQLVGTYDCCVKETIGEGCYRTSLGLKDSVLTMGMDVEKSNELVTVEGNSYFLRLFPVKKPKSIVCTHNGNTTIPQNILFNTKGARHHKKFHDYYQLKIVDIGMENAGKYVCESTIPGKEGTLKKTLTVLVEKEKRKLPVDHKNNAYIIRPSLIYSPVLLVAHLFINGFVY